MSAYRIFNTCLFSVLLLLLIIGCENDPTGYQPKQIDDGSWIIYSPYDWSHDGQPYVCDYCIVYSDGASKTLKKKAGEFCDTKFLEILEMFNFNDQAVFYYHQKMKRSIFI